MKNDNFHKVWGLVKFHATIMFRGFVRTIYGAMVAGLIAIAAYGFFMISTESGYVAVFDFIAACATLTVAITNVYAMGGKKRGARK